MITAEEIKLIAPTASLNKVKIILPDLIAAMEKYEINTRLRICCFLSQVLHESQCFLYSKELANGKAYEGRIDLGNTSAGDGVRFKGRGWIQVTGRANYLSCGKALGQDFIGTPSLLETTKWASYSAGWFWNMKGLNKWADKADNVMITKRINGGYAGLDKRMAFYNKALEILK